MVNLLKPTPFMAAIEVRRVRRARLREQIRSAERPHVDGWASRSWPLFSEEARSCRSSRT
jgi:hypothetical protein